MISNLGLFQKAKQINCLFKLSRFNNYNLVNIKSKITLQRIGDWGLGIGDCPIPNPQSPIPKFSLLNNKSAI